MKSSTRKVCKWDGQGGQYLVHGGGGGGVISVIGGQALTRELTGGKNGWLFF